MIMLSTNKFIIDKIIVREAKRTHKNNCDWCKEKIVKGDKYRTWACIDKPIGWSHVYLHDECCLAWAREYDENENDELPDKKRERGKTWWEAEEDKKCII